MEILAHMESRFFRSASGLEFEGAVRSDTAPLWPAVEALFEAGIEVHCLRDLTRGGLSSALNEIASVARLRITVEEALIPVSDVVRGACEMLGLDPLYVANEGRFVAFVPESDAGHALEILRSQSVSAGAVRAGTVCENPPELSLSVAGSEAIVCSICCRASSSRRIC